MKGREGKRREEKGRERKEREGKRRKGKGSDRALSQSAGALTRWAY